MTDFDSSRPSRSKTNRRKHASAPRVCETLESRLLYNAVTISGTSGPDVLTLGPHSTGSGNRFQQFIDWTLNNNPTQSINVSGVSSVVVDMVANTTTSGFDT